MRKYIIILALFLLSTTLSYANVFEEIEKSDGLGAFKEVSSDEKVFVGLARSGDRCRRLTPNICLCSILGYTSFTNDSYNEITVYNDNGKLGYQIAYNIEDKGIYTKEMQSFYSEGINARIMYDGKLCRVGSIWKYYRIGEGKMENGKFKTLFPKGTRFFYRRKNLLLSLGKDWHRLRIYIPGVKGKPAFVTYFLLFVGEKNKKWSETKKWTTEQEQEISIIPPKVKE